MRSSSSSRLVLAAALGLCTCPGALGQSFVNWESPPIHPLDLTPDAQTLVVANTADNRLEVFDVSSGTPVPVGAVPVGLDPVTVRARTNTEVWVVNHISDSVSIVDLHLMTVVRTLSTGDEPCDVVFAGLPERAYVSVSQENRLAVFDPATPDAPPTFIPIEGEDPRALVTDGSRVIAAIFESGNNTTILDRLAVSGPANPYPGGANPPPNNFLAFSPPINATLPTPPQVGLIVKKDAAGVWRDDNVGFGADWSSAVPWDLHDHDLAIVDTNTNAVTYATGLMNINMAVAMRGGLVTVVGTDAINQVRFEPNVNGVFVRCMIAGVNPSNPVSPVIVDLNPHLTYTAPTIPLAQRLESIGDPRGLVWLPDTSKGYVTGMGSDNVIVLDTLANRIGRINVGQGPVGLALDAANNRLYVHNRFDATIQVIDTLTDTASAPVSYYDPTPSAIKDGRPFLYNTQQFSGLGQASCGSCHVDARMDQLAWDLGDPSGAVKPFNQSCVIPGNPIGCGDWHPMKGPMVTQSLIGLPGTGPLHWRGDRENLAAFNPAFVSLMGADFQITPAEMQLFDAFVTTMKYPPNPFRKFDGTTQNAIVVAGGNPSIGEDMFFNRPLDGGATCNACHTAPTGTNGTLTPAGALQDTQSIKVPQLRNMYEKTGFDVTSSNNNRGFGFVKDGAIDTMFNFLLFPAFAFTPGAVGDQERRDMAAFMMSFNVDTHAAVGVQTTLSNAAFADPAQLTLISDMETLANTNAVGLVVKGVVSGEQRGFAYLGGGQYQSDRLAQVFTAAQIQAFAAPGGGELTYTVVPKGSETRIGIDRDEDTHFDRDELDAGSDPADPLSVPIVIVPLCTGDSDGSGTVDFGDITSTLGNWLNDYTLTPLGTGPGDADGNGVVNFGDITAVLGNWLSVCP